MKKVLTFLCSVLIILSSFAGINAFLKHGISKYYDNVEIGSSYGLDENDKGIEFQSNALNMKNVVMMYGSSEFRTKNIYTHPANFFKNNNDGFELDMIGRGHSQSIIHSINFGALSDKLKDKKVVFFISPAWFDEKGLGLEEFAMNFSEVQFYEFMQNKNISSSIKSRVAERVYYLCGDKNNYENIKNFCSSYMSDRVSSKLKKITLKPYYFFENKVLKVKDNYKSYKYAKKSYVGHHRKVKINKAKDIDWKNEYIKAANMGDRLVHNEVNMDDDIYKTAYKGKLDVFKHTYSTLTFKRSPEYNDFDILLSLCKEQNIKPLFVLMPLNGCFFDKVNVSRASREYFYNRVKNMVTSKGFQLADFSDKEYEKYFLVDSMHFGWKGWVYVDEAIDKYYKNN